MQTHQHSSAYIYKYILSEYILGSQRLYSARTQLVLTQYLVRRYVNNCALAVWHNKNPREIWPGPGKPSTLDSRDATHNPGKGAVYSIIN